MKFKKLNHLYLNSLRKKPKLMHQVKANFQLWELDHQMIFYLFMKIKLKISNKPLELILKSIREAQRMEFGLSLQKQIQLQLNTLTQASMDKM